MADLWLDKSQSFALYDLFLFCFKFNVMCIQFQDVNYESMITMLCVVYTLFSFFHFVIFIFHTLFTTHWNSFYHVEKEEFLTLSLFLWLLFPRLVCILLPLCFFFPPQSEIRRFSFLQSFCSLMLRSRDTFASIFKLEYTCWFRWLLWRGFQWCTWKTQVEMCSHI